MPRRKAKQVCALSKEETRTFLAVTDKGRHAEYFRLAVVTGMRPGEIGGLRWDDIDFEHCTVSVQRSLAWKTKSVDGWILVPTKTERGRREISIPKSLADALAGLKRRQEDVMSKTGGSYQNDGFVFANKWGRPVYPRQFVRHVFKVAGLPSSYIPSQPQRGKAVKGEANRFEVRGVYRSVAQTLDGRRSGGYFTCGVQQ